MPIPDPTFDARTYRQILAEAMSRVPAHTPEWTNLNDSDPGVTLLQLFAFMTESIIYRANLIPERNRRKFLRLLGESPRAAEPSTGIVQFSNPKGSLRRIVLEPDSEVRAGKVPFRTRNGLAVLPLEARVHYKSEIRSDSESYAEIDALYKRLYASHAKESSEFAYYETRLLEPPQSGVALPSVALAGGRAGEAVARDGALWIALLARDVSEVDATRELLKDSVLTLGILPALGEGGCVIPPGGTLEAADTLQLSYEVPNTERNYPAYTPLDASETGDLVSGPVITELTFKSAPSFWQGLDPLEAGVGAYPPSLEDSDDVERLITWIRIRRRGSEAQGGSVVLRISWVGVNAARVVQRARVPLERLPDGTGMPDQKATLSNTPVLLDSVKLSVDGETWKRVEDLTEAAPEVPPRAPRLAGDSTSAAKSDLAGALAFTLDRESGEIVFGDGARGKRPPSGARILVSYDYGGGKAGDVAVGSIQKTGALDSALKVVNPVPTWGGSEPESVEEAERRIPATLRHRNRLVSVADFEDVTRRTPGVDLGRVDVRSLFHPDLPDQRAEGVVTVMVVPAVDPAHPTAPRPDQLFLRTVCEHLEPRRLVTTELHVRGPEYVPIWISVGFELVPGHAEAVVRRDVQKAIEAFLSPLVGGFEGKGWPLEKAVEKGEIAGVVTRTKGVAQVVELLMSSGEIDSDEPIRLIGLELPELAGIAVKSGDASALEELRGVVDESSTDDAVVPVPVVPVEC